MLASHQTGHQAARIGVADGRMLAQATQLDLPNPTHAARRLNAYPLTPGPPMPRPHALPPAIAATSALLLALLAPLALADQALRVVTWNLETVGTPGSAP